MACGKAFDLESKQFSKKEVNESGLALFFSSQKLLVRPACSSLNFEDLSIHLHVRTG